jgi:hypothetical protein
METVNIQSLIPRSGIRSFAHDIINNLEDKLRQKSDADFWMSENFFDKIYIPADLDSNDDLLEKEIEKSIQSIDEAIQKSKRPRWDTPRRRYLCHVHKQVKRITTHI